MPDFLHQTMPRPQRFAMVQENSADIGLLAKRLGGITQHIHITAS